jgi:hypothetical protein
MQGQETAGRASKKFVSAKRRFIQKKRIHLERQLPLGWYEPNDFHELRSPGTTISERVIDPIDPEQFEMERYESMP